MASHNLRIVVRFEFFRTITKRRFWVATLFVPVVVLVVFGLVLASNSSTDKASEAQKQAHFSFEYTDASGFVSPSVVARLGGTRAPSAQAGIEAVRAETIEAFFVYPKDPATQTIQVYGVDVGLFANGKYSSVAEAILQESAGRAIGSPELVALNQANFTTNTVTFSNGQISGGIDAAIPPIVFLAIFYAVILLLGNQMLSATLEEKENRVTEMILTTINPTSLILGKIISLLLIGVVQMLVFALPFALGYLFFRNELNLPNLDLADLRFEPEQMIVGALVLLGGFALFTGTLVALGAAMPTVKDAGPIYGALMVLIFVPFYTIALIISDPDAWIVQLLSFFPFSAPVTALLRNAFGTLPLWQAVIIIAELWLLSAIVLRLAVRLFRYGSIEYSRKVSIRDALQAGRASRAGQADRAGR
ncbi:ABC transporter permease [Glaciibacter psychrotolerans]|uniref:ABC-2 type transport system permease protein n=1 Tax=Glaciibacter psychrotolerans TaxID=670054 RepID=A0A7Z0J6U1_9MICO|nr:ABC transporter permease [Leifsonia psychrotolerans]NYJ20541.1 ABC-2 type transport system permease protein [Leifsonia psychrotolerans]